MLYLAILLPLLSLSSASPAPAAAASITQHRRNNDFVKIKSTSGDKCLSMAPYGEVKGYGFQNLDNPILHFKTCSLADQWVLTPNAIGSINKKDDNAKTLESMGAGLYIKLGDLAEAITDDQNGDINGKQCISITQFEAEVPPTEEERYGAAEPGDDPVELKAKKEIREAVETHPCGVTIDLVTGNTFEQGWEIIH